MQYNMGNIQEGTGTSSNNSSIWGNEVGVCARKLEYIAKLVVGGGDDRREGELSAGRGTEKQLIMVGK